MGCQPHAPAALPPGKTRYPLYRRLGGLQSRSGRVRKILLPPGFDPRTVQPVASRYTNRHSKKPLHEGKSIETTSAAHFESVANFQTRGNKPKFHGSRNSEKPGHKFGPESFCLPVSYPQLQVFSFWRNSPPVDQGLLILKVSRSHTTTHHSR